MDTSCSATSSLSTTQHSRPDDRHVECVYRVCRHLPGALADGSRVSPASTMADQPMAVSRSAVSQTIVERAVAYSVHVALMAYAQRQDGQGAVDDLCQDTVVAHSVAPDAGVVRRQPLPALPRVVETLDVV